MRGASFEAFKADIAEHGQREPIELLDGAVIDGRNRLKACRELGIEPRAIDVELPDGTDLIAYCKSKNESRRHLSPKSRAIVAARLANLPHGGNRRSKTPNGVLKIDDAAALMQVGTSSVDRAKRVIEGCTEEIVALVEDGELSANKALDFAELIPDKREQAKLAKQGAAAIKESLRCPADGSVTKESAKKENATKPVGILGDLHRFVYKLLERTPKEMLSGIVLKLRDMADDIEEHGGVNCAD